MSPSDPWKPIQNPLDRHALVAAGFPSIDSARKEIREKGAEFFRRFPEDLRLRLVRDLIADAKEEAANDRTSWLSRSWLDLVLGLAGLLVLFLLAWAFFKGGSVAIALRDLRAGERLESGALHGAERLELPDGERRGPALRLKTSIPAGGYLSPSDLERFEVIAVHDILKDAVIPADAVRQEWRSYGKEPAALIEEVAGNRATRKISAQATIRPDDVESESVLVEQVVARRRLPRLHRIVPQDLRLERRSRQSGAVVTVAEAVGHYSLQEIEAGTTLPVGSLSPGTLEPNSLAGRHLLTLRVQPPSFRLVPRLPARVLLAATAPGEGRSLLLRNVIVLAVEPGKDGPAIVAALTETDLQGLVPFLSDAQVFLLQSPP